MTTAFMLRASSDIINRAKEELLLRASTASQLATELDLAVQLVEHFLNGEMVDRNTYDLVCQSLNIAINPFQDISPYVIEEKDATSLQVPDENKGGNSSEASLNISRGNSNVDDLRLLKSLDCNSIIDLEISLNEIIKAIRRNITSTLIRQCDRLKIININHPLNLRDVYIETNVFTVSPSSQYLDLDEIFANVPPEQYDRISLKKLYPSTVPASQVLEKSIQILLVGGLGSGKTTLLKYWAMTCVKGEILPDYLPIFLPLQFLVSPNDLGNPIRWIKKQLINYGWLNELLDETSENQLLERLLNEGSLFLLWDGFDELPEIYRSEIAQQILMFSDRYPQNRMVISTRNPIYSHIFESFSISEIAPFKESQINAFAKKWFEYNCPEQKNKSTRFQQLLSENEPLAEIATTPLLLTSLCTTFNGCEYIKANFYQEILNLFLNKWEETKCLPIHYNDDNLKLSTSQKLDLLSYVAIVALDRHGYLWQNLELEEDFQSCLQTSRSLSSLEIDRDRLFSVFQWQHSLLFECAKGLYRFTHATIHDYFAAYRLANSAPKVSQKYLLDRIHFKRWHGVIVMTVSISQQADLILKTMKRKIDDLVSQDHHLQSFLTWVNQQSIQIQTPYKAVTIRALYLDIDLENTRSLDRARALDIAHSRSLERARTKAMGLENTMATEVDIDHTVNLALNLDLALYFANHSVLELACILEPELNKGLQFLLHKFPDPHKNRSTFATWWQSKGLDWSKKIRALIVHHRKSSQDWQFSENQLRILRTYHDSNKLLIECLNHAEYVSPLIKNQIESTLLLPQGEYSILH